MRARERFLMELYRRAEGRRDRTIHAHLHVAKPLHLSEAEARAAIAALLRDGLIEADAMYDRLIWLTPRGIAACEQGRAVDAIVPETVTADDYVLLTALRGVYAGIDAAADRELVAS